MSSILPQLGSSAKTVFRIGVVLALGAAVVGTSGCRWFRKGDPYAMTPESRPLEVPPELDTQEAERAVASTASGSVSRSSLGGGGAQASTVSFNVASDRASTFSRVGEVLAATPGLVIASRAQLLGAFDVDYEGSKFLIRVSDAGSGSVVAAVDPRGQPAQGAAPTKLIATLKAALQR